MIKPSAFILAPLGVLYGGIMRVRRALYNGGALKVQRVRSPVISVGNITTGGTGKTPLVEWIARAAARDGRSVCVLSRGYGRSDENKRVLVSDGERVLAEFSEAGDEPRLLGEELLGVASVICDADRVGAANWAEDNLRSDVFILDDGFQHFKIARDLDVVVVDATNPWGGGRLLPHGRLREPLSELARADCVIVTRSELVNDTEALRAEIEGLNKDCLILTSRTCTKSLRRLGGSDTQSIARTGPSAFSRTTAKDADAKKVAAFCAIGNPEAFFEHVRRDGHQLTYTRAFADHHVYSQDDVDAIASNALDAGADILVTTAKDSVKLRQLTFALPCYVLEIELEFENEEKLLVIIRQALTHRHP